MYCPGHAGFEKKMSEQTDWHAKQPSQAGHIINDLKFLGA